MPRLQERISHAKTPGRLRLRLGSGTPSDLARLAESLAGLEAISSVRCRPSSRSIVVQHAPAADARAEVERVLAERSVDLRAPGARSPSDREAPGEGGTIGSSAAGVARAAIPVWLGALALAQAVRGTARLRDAPWYVLAWYAYATSGLSRRERAA